MKTFKLIIIIALFFSNQLAAQTTVPSIISTDQIWDAAGSPYMINQNTLLQSGVSVKLTEGAEIIGSKVSMTINGEFQVLGSATSLAKVSGITLHFTDSCDGYNPANGSGAYMQFADVDATNSLYGAIFLSQTDFKIEDSRLLSGSSTSLDLRSSESSLFISRCEFSGNDFGSLEIIYFGNYRPNIYIDNSTFTKGNLNVGNCIESKVSITKCTFIDFDYIRIADPHGVEFMCNTFKNMRKIELENRNDWGYEGALFRFEYNTLDSFSNYMIDLRGAESDDSLLIIQNNNFLSANKKISIYGTNSNLATSMPIDFTNNYWGTTNTKTLDSAINDYNDDIKIYGKVNYSNYLTSPITSCILPCPSAEFAVNIAEDSIVTFTHLDSGSSAYRRKWDFGNDSIINGQGIQGESFTFTFSDSGTYTACLYTIDLAGDTCNSICHTFVIAPFCKASYYVAKDTTDPFNMYIIQNCKKVNSNTSYYWNFGDGNTSTDELPKHTYDSFGNYNLCLTISDPATKCNSQFCDTIGMDSTGKYYKKDGFTINILKIAATATPILKSNIHLYPNPSKGTFTIDIGDSKLSNVEISIQNHTGQEIYRDVIEDFEGSSVYSIDLRNQSNGVYFIRLKLDDQLTNHKILITK